MSRSLSSKLGLRRTAGKPLQKRDWRALALFPAWVVAIFYATQVAVGGLLWLLGRAGVDFSHFGSEAVLQTVVSALIYVVAIAVTITVPFIALRRRTTLETLGLTRLMSWLDIGLAPLAYIAYVLVLLVVLAIIGAIVPGFQADQAQDVGFKTLTNQTGYILAFTTLVVIAPIAEETLFRGYLYGKLRRHVPFWAALLATSLVFAAVHGQWNVGIDTFVLSVFLCSLRELTGSIWAGILVHMIKNGIAFYILFISQLIGPSTGS